MTNIRQTIRDSRKKLSSNQIEAASKTIFKKIISLPEFSNAQHIAYYLSNENEIDPSLIIEHARHLKKSLYLPIFLEQNQLAFYLIDLHTPFKKNKFNIMEPIILNQSPIPFAQFDLMLIPLVAFDKDCHRLGRGAGCYDRYLALTQKLPQDQRPILIGLAYEFQKIDNIIPENWDVAMDYIVTEEALYKRPLYDKNMK